MHPSALSSEPEATYAENVQRAHELRRKAQQLAKDELAVLNQAVDLNLLARQLAEATMRPAFMPAPTSVPFYISVPAGMGNPAFRMQLMRAQQAAMGSQAAQYLNFQTANQPDAFKPAAAPAAASPAAASSSQSLPQPSAAAGPAAAPAGSGELPVAAVAAGIEPQQSAAQQTISQATAEAIHQQGQGHAVLQQQEALQQEHSPQHLLLQQEGGVQEDTVSQQVLDSLVAQEPPVSSPEDLGDLQHQQREPQPRPAAGATDMDVDS